MFNIKKIWEDHCERVKLREQLEQQKNQQVIEESKARANQEVSDAKTAMLSRSCAVNNMYNCTDQCIHFKEGTTKMRFICVPGSGSGISGVFYEAIPPKCKLWKEEQDD